MTSKEDLLLFLKENLASSEYAARLQEEISDHFDDSMYAEMIGGAKETDAIHATVRRLGSTSGIIREFRIAMKYRSSASLYLEAVAIGCLSVPLYLLMLVLMLVLGPHTVVVPWLLVIPVGAMALYYRVTLASLLRFVESREALPYLLMIVLGIPAAVMVVVFRGWGTALGGQVLREAPKVVGYIVICFASAVGSSFYFTGHIYREQQQIALGKKKPSQLSQQVSAYGVIVVSWILILSILLTTFLRIPVAGVWSAILTPFAIIRILPEFILMATMNFLPNPPTLYWIFCLALTVVTVMALFLIVKRLQEGHNTWRTLPWFAIVVATYGICLLFFAPTDPGRVEPTWSVPVRSASEVIERKQLGPFYRIVKYLNHEEGHFAHYTIGLNEEGFILRQNETKNFVLSDIQDVQTFHLEDQRGKSGLRVVNIPNARCFDVGIDTEVQSKTTDPGTLQTCHDLYINDKKVFEMPPEYGTMVLSLRSDIAVSADGNWALITLYTFGYDPHEVYLVDLR